MKRAYVIYNKGPGLFSLRFPGIEFCLGGFEFDLEAEMAKLAGSDLRTNKEFIMEEAVRLNIIGRKGYDFYGFREIEVEPIEACLASIKKGERFKNYDNT